MVLKTELCRFSGAKIYPGKGIRFVRGDSQVFLFANSKCKRYFHNRLKPSKLTWTAMYRKQHKKDIAQEAVRKRRRAAKKPYSRSIVGATLEVIQKKRAEKPEVRDAAREAALRCVFILFVSAYFCICIFGFVIDVYIITFSAIYFLINCYS
uniref:Large ribosomal subunit protein eL24 n=1 Tax=Glycine max TaxID=3847 RepID=I1NAH4_SOYBN